MIYKVGERYPELATGEEIVSFTVQDDGMTYLIGMPHLTENELSQFKADTQFEARYVNVRGIFFLLCKFGTMEWMDAPYNPAVGRPFELHKLGTCEGYAFHVMLFDTATGELKTQRLIGLGELFSRGLKREFDDAKRDKMSVESYLAQAQYIQSVYSTKDLVRMAGARCRFRL